MAFIPARSRGNEMDIDAFVLAGFALLRQRRIRPGHLFELDPILTESARQFPCDHDMALARVIRQSAEVPEPHLDSARCCRSALQAFDASQQCATRSHRPPAFPSPTDPSLAVTRASISSISMALAAWLKIESATRARTDAGVFWSISSFSSVVAAAEVPCWSRAMACPNAARRAYCNCSSLRTGAYRT